MSLLAWSGSPNTMARIGIGTHPISWEGRPDAGQAAEVLSAAIDAGVRLFDTANSYHLPGEPAGYAESLLGKVVQHHPLGSKVRVATKGGRLLGADGVRFSDARPEALMKACRESRERLGVDSIWLYQLHRPDPAVPYAESVAALAELRRRGEIQHAGLSNADLAQLEIGREVLGDGLVAIQNEYSPWFRSSEVELQRCAELGLAFLPWSAFGGLDRAQELAGSSEMQSIAKRFGCTVHQVLLLWLLDRPGDVIPIPGVRRMSSLQSIIATFDLDARPDIVAAAEPVINALAVGASAA